MLPIYVFRSERDEDRRRFARLYKKNRRQLHRLAAGLLGPGPRAEDAVHDGFVKLIQHYDRLRDQPDSHLERWLLAVVRNRAPDMLRKEARETELDPETWEPAAPPDLGEFQTLVSLICGMPEDYRRVLELRFVAEWSLEEIAQELGLTEGAVKSRVFRGRKLLADRLRKEGYLDGETRI